MKISLSLCFLSLAVFAIAGSTAARANSTDVTKPVCHVTCTSGPNPVCHRICVPTN